LKPAPKPVTVSIDFATFAPSTDAEKKAFDKAFPSYFTDFSGESGFEFAKGLAPIPNLGRQGFMFSAHNRSDDVWASIVHPIGVADGVVANTTYKVTAFRTKIASNEGTGCFGSGGSPGASIFIKGDVVNREPIAKKIGTRTSFAYNTLVPTLVNKGNQADPGQSIPFGNLENSLECGSTVYETIDRTGALTGRKVKSTADGSLWLYLGTDSGYEGKTTYYVQSIEVTLTPSK
jgi:hypothetical protein